MTSVDVLDVTGKKAGTATLPAELFDVQANIPLIHQVVVAQLAAARQGTQSPSATVKYRVPVRSRSSRREPVALVRVRYVLLRCAAVTLLTVQSLAPTNSALLKR